ncbi:MAG: pilus (MSHA type) biogenesis protein MshL [Candidatus Accumulibacter sp.]|nr:pilus (MSHA type) biogenesis protein MshL [Accumulibacter sp.]
MKPKIKLLSALCALFLTGCATHLKAPGATFDRVSQELKEASAAKPKSADDAVSQAMLPPVQLDLPASAKAVEPRFDLAVSNAPAAQVFMALVTGTRYSMLVAPEVTGNVTVNLKSVTVREALETLRELYGYEFKFQGTRIYIQSNAMQTRIFQINYLAGQRQGQSDLRVTSSSISSTPTTGSGNANQNTGTGAGAASLPAQGAGGATGARGYAATPSSRISTTSNNDFWRDLSDALTSIVGTEGGRNVILNPGSGVVVVKAFPADLRTVEAYLKATQVIVERQVMLEAKILEVALNEEYQSGVNWAKFGGASNRYGFGAVTPGTTLNTSGAISGTGVAVTPGTAGTAAATAIGKGFFGLAFQSANFAALLNFLETQGNVQVLSSPRIATINNQKAVLKVGTDEFYVTNVTTTVTTSSAGGNLATPSISLQPFFSGIALDVTPQIDDNNNIILHVHPSISVVAEKQKTIDLGKELGQFVLPLATSKINETDSVVRVQDGSIVAIGGLMTQEQSADRSGLPGASNIPVLGTLFGQRSSALKKRELVILIKPTLIQNESSWREDLLETQSRIEQLDPRRRRAE